MVCTISSKTTGNKLDGFLSKAWYNNNNRICTTRDNPSTPSSHGKVFSSKNKHYHCKINTFLPSCQDWTIRGGHDPLSYETRGQPVF